MSLERQIANYLNGLIQVCQFVYQTYEVDADALGMSTTPLDELLRLRGQCESQAKQQQLYSRRDANWSACRAPPNSPPLSGVTH